MEHELMKRIIECVRKHKFLYDPSDVNYKNPVLKKRTWRSIAFKLNEQCHTIKTKWKTVRDGYIKFKKQARSSDCAHYIWEAHLAFLDGSLRLRGRSRRAGRSSSGRPRSPAPDRTATEFEEVELASCPQPPDLHRMMYEYLSERKPGRETYDSVDHLFLSYAQTFKVLSQRTQAALKLTLAKLFSEAELSELPLEHAPLADSSSQT